MRSPEKRERTFLSKMFRTISIYMIIALCSFFSYIMLFGDVSFTPTLPGSNVDASEDSNMNKLLNAFMGAENVTANMNISVVGNDLDVDLDVDAKVNMQNFDFDVTLKTALNDTSYNIEIFKNSELDSFLHININDSLFKLDLNEISSMEEIDFSALLSSFSGGEQLSSILDAVGTVIGVDLTDLSMENIMTKLEIVENVSENAYRFTIYFGNLRLTLDTSEDFKNMTASVRELTVNNYKINCAIDSITLDDQNFDIDTEPAGEELDISSLLKIVENAKLDDNSYALSGDVVVKYDGKELAGSVGAKIVDSGNGVLPFVRFKTNVGGVDAYIYYIDNTIYLSIEQLNFKFDIDNIPEIESILEEYNINLDVEALMAVTVAMPTFENFNIKVLENGFELSLQDEIIFDDTISLSNSNITLITKTIDENILPDLLNLTTTLTMDGTPKEVGVEISNIMIGQSTQYLSDMELDGNEVLNLNTKSGMVSVQDYVDLANFIDIFKVVKDAENITFNIDVEIDDLLKVSGLGKFDIKSMSFNLDVDVDIDGLKLNIFLYGEDMLNSHVVYATIGEKSLKLNLDEANLTELLTEFGVSMDTASALDKVSAELGVDFENIDILEILKNLTLTESEENGVLTYTISLLASENEESTAINSNEVTSNENLIGLILTYNKNTNTFGLNFAKNISGYDITLNVSDLQINASDFALTAPTGNEEDITPIFDIVENAKVENGYALSSVATITLDDKSYQARISAQLLKSGNEYLPYISLSTEIEGVKINAYLVEEEIYLNVENLMFAVNINELDIEELTNILEEEFNLSADAIETITIAMPALADITISGLTNGFNISLDSEIVVNDNLKLSNSDLDIVTYADNGVMVLDYIQISSQLSATGKAYSLIFKLDDIMLGEEAEGLDTFVFTDGKVTAINIDNNTVPTDDFVRVENLLKIFKEIVDAENLTFNIDVEIDDLLKVSGLGKFDIKSMSFNLDVDVDIDGLKLNIFLYGEDMLNSHVVYATIGEKSLKLNLDEANLTELLTEFGVSMDTASALDKVSAELGVDFENIDILEILKNLTLTESEENGVLTYTISLLASENEESTAINSNEVTSNENLIGLILTYNKNTNTFGLNFAKNISGYDITLNVSDLQINASDFTLTAPTGNEEDITPIFDIVEDIKVDDYTYAISGDLAVRYSTTSFYGDMLAMIVRKGEEYVPYVRVYTSAMNIETYIYLLDDDIYLDLQGLRLTFNLSESTIDEILTFVSDDLKLTISGMENLTATFNVILPALNSISANWIDGGVQINIGEDLKYTETAKFADIVMQAFGESANGKIYPTKVVIGANIVDPNTDIYDSYEEWWLENEEAITKDKNFAIYLSNVAIGTNSLFMDDIVFDELGNVMSLKGKDGKYSLNNFENIKGLLSLAKGLLDYLNNGSYSYTTEDITATLYKLSLNAKLGNTEFTDSNVLVELAEEINAENKAEEDRKIVSTLFGGKSLKVQGDMNITTTSVSEDNTSTTTAHEASIYYNSNEYEDENTPNTSGLYITYAHDNFINSDTKFRGHIENASMSDLIAMILGITNVKLDPAILESWDLTTSFEQSTTDFSFLRELMGLNKEEGDDVVTTVDSTLLSVSNILKMLDNISFVNEDSTSSLIISIVSGEDVGNLTILFTKEIVDGVTVCSPTSISFTLGDMYANINFEYGEPADDQQTDTNSNGVQDNFEFTYNTSATHHDLSSLPEFMDIAVNKINERTINLSGTAYLKILTDLTAINIDVDVTINLVDFSFVSYLSPEALIGTTYLDRVSAFFGETTKYSTIGEYDKRVSTITFAKDGNGEYILTIHQDTDGSVKEWSYKTSEMLGTTDGTSNIIIIMAQAIGLTDSMVDLITWGMGLMEPNISLEETLQSFNRNTVEETTESGTIVEKLTGYTLGIKGETLTGTSLIGDFDLTVGVSENNGEYALSNVVTTMKIFASMVTLDLDLGIL